MYCPAKDVYWRDDAGVILLIGPIGGFRLMGPVADCWRTLASNSGDFEAQNAPPPTDLGADPQPGAQSPEAWAVHSLLEAKLLVASDDRVRWQTSNLQHLPASVGAPPSPQSPDRTSPRKAAPKVSDHDLL